MEDANLAGSSAGHCIPILDAVEFAFSTTADMELKSLTEALKHLDATKWVEATLKEIEAHIQNSVIKPTLPIPFSLP